jgi:hypothetical protein
MRVVGASRVKKAHLIALLDFFTFGNNIRNNVEQHGLASCFCKRPNGKYLRLEDHRIFVAITKLCPFNLKTNHKESINKKDKTISIKFYLQS